MVLNVEWFLGTRSLPSTACMHAPGLGANQNWSAISHPSKKRSTNSQFCWHPNQELLSNPSREGGVPCFRPVDELDADFPHWPRRAQGEYTMSFFISKTWSIHTCKLNGAKGIQPLSCEFQTTPLGDLLNWEMCLCYFVWFCTTK